MRVELDRRHVRTLIVIGAVVLLVAWGLFRPEASGALFEGVMSVLKPFILGLAIAFVVNLVLQPLERGWDALFGGTMKPGGLGEKARRPVSIFLSVTAIGTVFFVLLFIVVPEVARTFVVVADALPQYFAEVEAWWGRLAVDVETYGIVLPQFELNVEELGPMLTTWLTEQAPTFLATTLGFTTSFLAGIFTTVVGIVFALYVLADKERLGRQLRSVLRAFLPEERAKAVVRVARMANKTFAGYVTGQITDAFIVGVLCYIGMRIMAMPHPAAVSVLVGATTIVPVIGVLMGTIVGALLILVVDPMKAFWFLVFIVVLQQLESNFIYPRVVGKSVGLPGLWVLAAVTVGGLTFGVLGMLVAVPIVSVLYTLMGEAVRRRLAQK